MVNLTRDEFLWTVFISFRDSEKPLNVYNQQKVNVNVVSKCKFSEFSQLSITFKTQFYSPCISFSLFIDKYVFKIGDSRVT